MEVVVHVRAVDHVHSPLCTPLCLPLPNAHATKRYLFNPNIFNVGLLRNMCHDLWVTWHHPFCWCWEKAFFIHILRNTAFVPRSLWGRIDDPLQSLLLARFFIILIQPFNFVHSVSNVEYEAGWQFHLTPTFTELDKTNAYHLQRGFLPWQLRWTCQQSRVAADIVARRPWVCLNKSRRGQ